MIVKGLNQPDRDAHSSFPAFSEPTFPNRT